jgi:nicotinate-nucleotide adenylyltransferase
MAGALGRRRIGVLGGSFNPAHAGHRHISREALKRLRLHEVWWLVSPQNPLKPAQGMAELDKRLAHARTVAAGLPIRVLGLESTLHTRYTVDTLAALRRRWPRARFVWLMGADNLASVHRWRRWPGIFQAVPVAIFDRPRYSQTSPNAKAALRFRAARWPKRLAARLAAAAAPAWVFVDGPRHPLSATVLRAREPDWAATGRIAPATKE